RALPPSGVAVFPADDTYTPLWRSLAKASGKRKMLSFGLTDEASVSCSWKPAGFGSEMTVRVKEHSFTVQLQAAGVHNVRNALAAIACALAIGVHRKAIVRGLESFAPVSGRLQRKRAPNGATVIDDTYNANPDSVRAAIDVLAQGSAPRILVLGDMGEVGQEGRQFHIEIGAYARGRGIEQLFTLGDLAQHASAAFGAHGRQVADVDALKAAVQAACAPNATVLVKGSRFMRMERVVQHLTGETQKEAH
ncbi:MAG: murF, partial [Paucimonas sp.]|nr:murF [Paucimonas sp.]